MGVIARARRAILASKVPNRRAADAAGEMQCVGEVQPCPIPAEGRVNANAVLRGDPCHAEQCAQAAQDGCPVEPVAEAQHSLGFKKYALGDVDLVRGKGGCGPFRLGGFVVGEEPHHQVSIDREHFFP